MRCAEPGCESSFELVSSLLFVGWFGVCLNLVYGFGLSLSGVDFYCSLLLVVVYFCQADGAGFEGWLFGDGVPLLYSR